MKFNKNEFGWSTKNESSSSSGGGLTPAQENKLNIAYNHSKEEHFSGDYNDLINKPTNISEFNNDANYASETYVTNKIAEASLSGGGGNVSQITQLEPEELDMPKVFFYGTALPTTKDNVNLTMDYISNTTKFSSFVKLKCQGTSSMSYAKKNFTVAMYSDEARATKLKKDFKGWGAQSKFCLKANYVDTTHTRNISGARIAYDMVQSRPDSEFKQQLLQCPRNGAVDGFPIKLYFNGEFYGIYTWNIPKDGWMFNMDKNNPNHVVLCAERNTDGNANAINSCQFRKLWTDGDGGDWSVEFGTYSTDMVASLNRCINFVMTATDQEFHDNIGEYFDLYSLLDYYCFSYLTCHLDGLAKNMLMATYDGVIWGACLYDMDSIYGVHWNGNSYVATNYQCPEQYQEQFSLLWQRIERCFSAELYARYLELRQEALSLSNIIKHVEEIYDVIPDRVFADEKAKWTGLPQVNTNTMTRFRNYMRDRAVYVDAQMQEIGTPQSSVECTGITLDKHELVLSSSSSEETSEENIDITQNTTAGYIIRGGSLVSTNGGMSYFGNVKTSAVDTTTDFIPFTSNNTLTISQPSSQYGCDLVAYDSNKQALACYTVYNTWDAGDTYSDVNITTSTVQVIAPPSNTAYIRICFNLTNLSDVTVVKKNTNNSVSSYQLIATVTPENCTQPVVWSVDPTGIVTVDNGLVRAVTNGEATVTATCGTQTATCAVTVSGMSESGGDTDTTLLYSLPEETVFDGTSTYIDTGVALLSTDQDFTIALDVTATNAQTSSQATIFHCMHEESPYLGLSLMTSTGDNGFYIPKGSNAGVIGKAPYLIPLNGRAKVVVIKEGARLSAYSSNNVTVSSPYTYTQVNENLLIGAFQQTNGDKGRYFLGTIRDFKIYNKAFTSEEKDAYLDINGESSRVFKIDSTCMNTTDNTLTDNIAGISATLTGNPTVSGNQIVFTADDKFSFDLSSLNLTSSNRTLRVKFTPTTLDANLRNAFIFGETSSTWNLSTTVYISHAIIRMQHGSHSFSNCTVGSNNGGSDNNRLSSTPATNTEYEVVISENVTTNEVRWFINGTLVQNGISTLFNPLYLSNMEGTARFIGNYSLIEIYNGYCNDYTEFTNMVNNASSGTDTDVSDGYMSYMIQYQSEPECMFALHTASTSTDCQGFECSPVFRGFAFPEDVNDTDTSYMICDSMATVTDSEKKVNNIPCITGAFNGTKNYLTVKVLKTNASTTDEFKTYFRENPTYIKIKAKDTVHKYSIDINNIEMLNTSHTKDGYTCGEFIVNDLPTTDYSVSNVFISNLGYSDEWRQTSDWSYFKISKWQGNVYVGFQIRNELLETQDLEGIRKYIAKDPNIYYIN